MPKYTTRKTPREQEALKLTASDIQDSRTIANEIAALIRENRINVEIRYEEEEEETR